MKMLLLICVQFVCLNLMAEAKCALCPQSFVLSDSTVIQTSERIRNTSNDNIKVEQNTQPQTIKRTPNPEDLTPQQGDPTPPVKVRVTSPD